MNKTLNEEEYTKIYQQFSRFLDYNSEKYNTTREDICMVVLSYIDVNTDIIDNWIEEE